MLLDIGGSLDVSLIRYAVQLVLYIPANVVNKVAWGVICASLAMSDIHNLTLVTINEGGACDNASNSVIVPVTGVYYLMLTVDAPLASPSRHRIMLNSNTTFFEIICQRSTAFYFNYVTTDKSIILSLATSDVLTYHLSE